MNKTVFFDKLKGFLLSKPKLSAVIFFIILVFITSFLIYQRNNYLIEVEKSEANNILNIVEKNIEHTFQSALTSTLTLALSVNDNGIPEEFEKLGKQLVDDNKFIDGIQLVPNGVIKYVYPYEVNKAALNYNILEDPKTNKEAKKAIEQKRFYLAGPFTLKQGGVALVGRLPIFRQNKFWGFSAVLVYLNTLIKNAGIDSTFQRDYFFQLSKINPNTLEVEHFLPNKSNKKREVIAYVEFPESNIKISIAPINPYKLYYELYLFGFISLLAAFSFSGLIYFILSRPAKLEKLVYYRTIELQESEKIIKGNLQKFAAIFNSSFQFTGLLTTDGKIIEANQTFLNYAQLSSEEIKGIYLWEISLWHIQDEKAARIERLKKAVETAAKNQFVRYEATVINKDNHIDYLDFSLKPMLNEKNKISLLIAEGRIITSQKLATDKLFLAHKQLKKLSSYLLEVRENERTEIARDIHDELGQYITALKMDLVSLKTVFYTAGEPYASNYESSLKIIEDLVKSVRELITSLRPNVLDDLGFAPAVEALLTEFKKHHPHIEVKSSLQSLRNKLYKEKAISLYRMVQEALNNISKHSKASIINVSAKLLNNEYVIIINDNGVGFNNAQEKNFMSFGIIGMKERADLMNASFEITSKPNEGTTICIRLPFKFND